jgi:hypothetical protein
MAPREGGPLRGAWSPTGSAGRLGPQGRQAIRYSDRSTAYFAWSPSAVWAMLRIW